MMNDIRFYDTCSLLNAGPEQLKQEQFVVSSVSINELERIKTSSNKDEDVKYQARLVTRYLDEHQDNYELVIHKQEYEKAITELGFDITDDTRILSDAIWYNNNRRVDEVIFVTNDICLRQIAHCAFGGLVESVEVRQEDYLGYLDITPTEEQLVRFYESPGRNEFECYINQYLILRDQEGNIIEIRKWTGSDYVFLKSRPFVSNWLGKISPINNDIYQQMACDSLASNKITMMRGPAGSGKSYLAMGFLMSQLDKGVIDKIIVFCNPVATMNSAKLGFYPGTRLDKLLDSQTGNFLIGKLGSREGVERLIDSGKLLLLPLSDVRGFDTSGMKAGIYITEAQNTDIPLMKLALQRAGEDCIFIVEGDDKAQVDLRSYEGSNNGMRRLSEVFRGQDIYGEVKLDKIYRSKITLLADAM